MTISLTDLKAKRAAMTPGEYHAWGTTIMASEPDPALCDQPYLIGTATSDDATGIVATHNAAGALIQIAEAAIACATANRHAAKVRLVWSREDKIGKSAMVDDVERADKAVSAATAGLTAALAKVVP